MDFCELLKQAVQKKASDLHISPTHPPKIRLHGDLIDLNSNILSAGEIESMVFGIMTEDQVRTLKNNLECDFAINFEASRFRINACFNLLGIAVAVRCISGSQPTLESLGAPDVVKKIAQANHGLVLVTGPTGSGKSTTLAAMIESVNQNMHKHIITIEDPIEFVYTSAKSLVNQRELGRHTLSFQDALKSALRENPDVIMVGEMRDFDSIQLALTAAETGHLVLSTLHTSGAANSVNRIIDIFPSGAKDMIRTMLSTSLLAVISQTLLKKADNSGRVAAFEIMVNTHAIKNLIKENKVAHINNSIQTGAAIGMQTMQQSIKNLVDRGDISEATAKQYLDSL